MIIAMSLILAGNNSLSETFKGIRVVNRFHIYTPIIPLKRNVLLISPRTEEF